MGLKIDDFKCRKCNHVSEIFINTSDQEDKPVCEECGSTDVEKILSVGSANDKHLSWAKWRV